MKEITCPFCIEPCGAEHCPYNEENEGIKIQNMTHDTLLFYYHTTKFGEKKYNFYRKEILRRLNENK